MKTKLFAIAKITRATGLKGDVSIRPLIRQFDEYVDRDLFIGFDKNDRISKNNQLNKWQE